MEVKEQQLIDALAWLLEPLLKEAVTNPDGTRSADRVLRAVAEYLDRNDEFVKMLLAGLCPPEMYEIVVKVFTAKPGSSVQGDLRSLADLLDAGFSIPVREN